MNRRELRVQMLKCILWVWWLYDLAIDCTYFSMGNILYIWAISGFAGSMVWFKECMQKCMLCRNVFSIEAILYFAVSWSRGILRVCIRSVCWSVWRQMLMLAHLVVFRPGLWWQTTGDEEQSSALQFRTVPTEYLRLTNHGVCLCVCSIFWWGALFVLL